MNQERLSPFQILILILSFYVLGAMAVQELNDLPPEVDDLLFKLDLVVCAFFFADFCIRFHRAESKWRFMRWGWIDLLASIPVSYFMAGTPDACGADHSHAACDQVGTPDLEPAVSQQGQGASSPRWPRPRCCC